MNGRYYIIGDDGKTPVRATMMEWARMLDDAKRIVAQEKIGDVFISTVFLGIDHQWGSGPPLLFETMIFKGEHDGYQTRCSTWDQAKAMHRKAIALVRGIKLVSNGEPE